MIRILLFRSFRIQIRILSFEPGKLNNWKILIVHNGTAARLFKCIGDFRRKYVQYVIKDELDHFLKKSFRKLHRFCFQKFISGSGISIIILDSDPTGYGTTTLLIIIFRFYFYNFLYRFFVSFLGLEATNSPYQTKNRSRPPMTPY
jgi:hypothetical protein